MFLKEHFRVTASKALKQFYHSQILARDLRKSIKRT